METDLKDGSGKINYFFTDELLNQTQLCKTVLHMDHKTASAFLLEEKGFPYVIVGKTRRYVKSQVIEWLVQHQKFN